MPYSYAYYFAALLAIASVPVFLGRNTDVARRGARYLVVMIVLLVYMAGMLRADGVDLEQYRFVFEVNHEEIPDVGFRWFMAIFKTFGLPFEVMMLVIGVSSIFSIRRLANYFNVSFGLLLILWFLHIAVVRDFAQFRSGFALALAVLGLTSKRGYAKVGWYLAALSCHLTASVFISAYEYCRWVAHLKNRHVRSILVAGAACVVLFAGILLPNLAFVDDRVSLYLLWEKDGYGLPVSSYGLLIFQSLVLFVVSSLLYKYKDSAKTNSLWYLQLIGVATFIGFRDYAIFSFRIANLILSLYPVILLVAISGINLKIGDRHAGRLTAIAVVMFFAFLLLLRPSSTYILNRIIL